MLKMGRGQQINSGKWLSTHSLSLPTIHHQLQKVFCVEEAAAAV